MLIHWFLASFFLTGLIAWQMCIKFPKIYGITFGYLMMLGMAVIHLRFLSAKEPLDGSQLVYLLSTTCFSAYVILLFGAAAYFADKIPCETILKRVFPLTAVAGAISHITIGYKLIPHASSHATVLALSLPYLIPISKEHFKKKLCAVLLILISIVDSNASSPLGVTAIVVASFLFFHGYKKWLWLALIPILIAMYIYGPAYVLSDTGRFSAYRVFMGYWWDAPYWINLFGYGSGSFETLSQLIQHKTGFMLKQWPDGRLSGELWMHAHSDALQWVFEYGVIGAGLIASCFYQLWNDLKGRINERVVLLGLLSATVFDFTMRYPVNPLILLLLFGVSIMLRPTKQ